MVKDELYIRCGVLDVEDGIDVSWCNYATGLYIALNLGQLLLIGKYMGYNHSMWPYVIGAVSYTPAYRDFLDRVVDYVEKENHVLDRIVANYPHGVKLIVITEV